MAKKRKRNHYHEDERYYDDRRSHSSGSHRKRRRKKRKVIILIIELIIFLLLVGALYVWAKLNLIKRDTSIDVANVGISEEVKSNETTKGYTNIALFGLDNRSNGNLSKGLSDVIMVCSINNDNGEIKLLSVFRDTYLAQGSDNSTYAKANAAYSTGGPEKAIHMLNTNLDLDITDYVTVDFYAVTEAVDLVGGVEVDVTEDEVDYVNGYAESVAEVTGKELNYITGPGLQTLDGVQATAYCRIRYTSGGDFTRAQRQRTVLSQIFKKAKKLNAVELNNFVDTILPDIQTSMTNTEILSFATKASTYKLADSTGFPFDVYATDVSEKGSVDVPCTLSSNVTKMYEFLYGQTDYVPSSTVQSISDHIVNETGYTEDSAADYGIKDDGLSETGTTSTSDSDSSSQTSE